MEYVTACLLLCTYHVYKAAMTGNTDDPNVPTGWTLMPVDTILTDLNPLPGDPANWRAHVLNQDGVAADAIVDPKTGYYHIYPGTAIPHTDSRNPGYQANEAQQRACDAVHGLGRVRVGSI